MILEGNFDSEVLEKALNLARTNAQEACRMALDCTTIASLPPRDFQKNPHLLKRLLSYFGLVEKNTIKQHKMTTDDLAKISLNYIKFLFDENILATEQLLLLKNQFDYRAKYITDDLVGIKKTIIEISNNISERVSKLEDRMKSLEATILLHDWMLTISESDYKNYPKWIRFVKIVDDFDRFTRENDILFNLQHFKSILRAVGIEPNSNISISDFICQIIDENNSGTFTADLDSIFCFSNVNLDIIYRNLALPFLVSIYKVIWFFSAQCTITKIMNDKTIFKEIIPLKDAVLENLANNMIDISYSIPLTNLAIEIAAGRALAVELTPKDGFFCINKECKNFMTKGLCDKPGFCSQCGNKLFPLRIKQHANL